MLHSVIRVQVACEVDAFQPLQSLGLGSFRVKIWVKPSDFFKGADQVCFVDIHLSKHVHDDELLSR